MKTSDLYSQEYYESQGYCFAAGDRQDHKRILELIPFKKNDRVLEIGSGLGVLLKRIPSKNKIGIETNDFAIKESRRRGMKVIKTDVEKGLPFKDSSFEVIIMNEVIEHFRKPKLVLKECYRVLRPKGKIIITTPAKNFFVHDLAESHFSEMTLSELRKIVKDCGFHTITQEAGGISFLYPLFENFCFKPFRLLRYKTIKKQEPGKSSGKTVSVIDFIHVLADRTILQPISQYRKFLLSIGTQQLILAEKR